MPVSPTSRNARALLAAALLAGTVAALLALGGRARLERADFVFTNGGEVRSLDPQIVTGIPEGRIVGALFEGLITRDPTTLAPQPGVAESWELDGTKRVYTFHLRANARWSNGDVLSADDFEWSFRRLLEPETGAEYASQLWCVVGARAFTTGVDAQGSALVRDWSKVGIRALDARTLRIELSAPTPYFLDVLAMHACVPVHRATIEALRERFPATWQVEWTRPGTLVTNGPFHVTERRLNDRIRLAKSATYWDAEHVALRTIDALAVENWNTALNLYLTGEVDWVDGSIPTNLVPRLLGREDFHPAPYLGIYFLRVNTTKPPLDDPLVRRALSMALQRGEICGKLLKAGQTPAQSFVPRGRLGAYKSPNGPGENVSVARKLLADAGFGKDAKAFPTIEFHFNSSEVHRDIAEIVAAQWKEALGIDVRLRNQEWKAFIDAQSRLQYDVSRSSWIADYADPSTFFEVWRSDSENNRTGWSNEQYDRLVERARNELDTPTRMQLYRQAEAVLLNDLPCIPIYAYVSQNLIAPRVGGFTTNLLDEPSLKDLYWMNDAELAKARADVRGTRVDPHGPRAGLHAPASGAAQ